MSSRDKYDRFLGEWDEFKKNGRVSIQVDGAKRIIELVRVPEEVRTTAYADLEKLVRDVVDAAFTNRCAMLKQMAITEAREFLAKEGPIGSVGVQGPTPAVEDKGESEPA